MGLSALQFESRTQFKSVAVSAPAKINLILDVLGRREDGFHEIQSLAIGIRLCDQLSVRESSNVTPSIECSDATLANADNLVIRAANALAQEYGMSPSVSFRLQKRIPSGSGLGGGSSDAAAALRACNDLWNINASVAALADVGAKIGSDVPLFFHLPAASISGRGEIVEPCPMRWRGFVLIVYPAIPIRTADVYKAWRSEDTTDADRNAIREVPLLEKAEEIHLRLRNRLEPAMDRVAPRLREAIASVQALGLKPFQVTGSGSAFFRLYDFYEEASHDAALIREHQPHMTVAVVEGPVTQFPLEHKES